MKLLLFLLFSAACFSQPTVTVANGTLPDIDAKLPNVDTKKFKDLTKAWITEVQRSGETLEVSNISSGSLTISGYKRNAFYYRERGETHWQNAKVVMQVSFTSTLMTIKITLPELYTKEGTPLKFTLPYYYANGKLKEGYDGLETSLEENLTKVVRSYYNFIVNYQ